jgi:hypothetical protein
VDTEEKIDELRAVTAEANSTLKALLQARRETEEWLNQYVEHEVDRVCAKHVQVALHECTVGFGLACDKIIAEMNKLTDIFLKGSHRKKEQGKDLRDIARARKMLQDNPGH